MRILHYSLGFPPYRTGGLTKFCFDLMKAQKEQGNETALLWPGKIGAVQKRIKIVEGACVSEIRNFELINPLPIPLDEGIKNIEAYMGGADITVYEEFLKKYNPDVIHMHTLMGIHQEFIQAADNAGIKIVFTTHDYFGICPKVTLYCKGHICKEARECLLCHTCNETALSLNKILIMQSVLYRKIKNSLLLQWLRKKHRTRYFEVNQQENLLKNTDDENSAEKYKKLRKFYTDMLEQMNCVHYNSDLTREIYQTYVKTMNYRVLPITHRNIVENKKIKKFEGKLKISYLAQAKVEKGYFWLTDTLDELWKENQEFILNVFTPIQNKKPYINSNSPYGYKNLEYVMDQTDVVIVPSMWYETFGFTVLEALSYGVPVIISDHVGAKILLGDFTEFIIEPGNKEMLKDAILKLTKEKLKEYNRYIVENIHVPQYAEMLKGIMEIYREY